MKPDERLLDCVHCGFCLSVCPTYAETGEEMESPRGRLYLIRALAEKRLPVSHAAVRHLELCLDCRACESACPSGVRYGPILEQARAGIAGHYRRPLRDRALSCLATKVLAEPERLRLLLKQAYALRDRGLASLLPADVRELISLLPPGRVPNAGLPKAPPMKGTVPLRVGFLAGCAARLLCPEMNDAMLSVLARNGCEMLLPEEQGCCGAIDLHAGDLETARRRARRNIDAFLPLNPDVIVANAAGCGSAMKEYGSLLADDPDYAERAAEFAARVRDFTELLAGLEGYEQGLGPLPLRAAYHDACHLAHAQGIREQPRALLAAIPELQQVELPESDWCCGSAGVYNITQPAMARRLLERKLSNVERTGAQVVVAANPGCLVQLRAGIRRRGSQVEVLHPAELLERSYRVGDGEGATARS